MVCDKCGFENEEGAQVCISCGSRLPAQPADLNSTKQIKGADALDTHPDTALDDVESTSSIDIAEMFGDDEDSGIGNSPKSDQPNDDRNEDQASDDGHGKFGEPSKNNDGTNFAASGVLGLHEFEETQYQPTFPFDIPTSAMHHGQTDGNGAGRQAQPGYAAQMNPANFANAAFGVNSGNLADLVNTTQERVSNSSSQGVEDANRLSNSDNPDDSPAKSEAGTSSPETVQRSQLQSQRQQQPTHQSNPYQSNPYQPPLLSQQVYPQNQPQTPAPKQADQQTSRNPRLLIGIGIAIAAMIAICLIIVGILNSGILDTDSTNVGATSSTPQQTTKSARSSKTVFDKKQLNTLISQFSASDAAIAGIDINGKDTYSSKLATTKFVAAGLYLPIYLDAHSGKNPDSIAASDVMMNTMSNDDANTAMADLGGFSGVTGWLHKNGYKSTEMGRNFGDVAASNNGLENYSTASDSAAMLKAAEAAGGANLMTYDITADGVTIPADMQVCAHRGRGIKNAYNYFLIIKDNGHTIALAILTKNQSETAVTTFTSKLLASIDSTIAK